MRRSGDRKGKGKDPLDISMVPVYIGFGSNLGDRENHIISALHLLSCSPRLDVLKLSSLYETEPADGVGGAWFLNGAAKVATDLQPTELLTLLQSIEVQLGRSRGTRRGPRTIDLDILLYGDHVVRGPDLTIPHPKMAQRSFVLVPLIEIEPSAVHPVQGRPLRNLLSEIESPTAVRFHKGLAIGDDLSPEPCL